MEIRTRNTSSKSAIQAKRTGASKKTGKGSFESVIHKNVQVTKSAQVQDVSKIFEGLDDLSKLVKDKKLTKEEASRKFVAIVLNKLKFKASAKKIKEVESLIADVVENDPNFSQKLEKSLKQL